MRQIEQMLTQFLGSCMQVDLAVSTPKVQDVAPLLAAKAIE
jgi:hypothetical protein